MLVLLPFRVRSMEPFKASSQMRVPSGTAAQTGEPFVEPRRSLQAEAVHLEEEARFEANRLRIGV